MRIVQDPAQLPATPSRPHILVPTMGALHAGHLALMHRARDLAGSDGTLSVSIFVNPIQFDRAEDLATYPQPLVADLDHCRAAGVDLVFTPTCEAMYAADRSVSVHEASLSRTLCGASRPGHFDGVCTVVLKLFNLLQPDHAIFGSKDFQQLAIIRRMVRDLHIPVAIVSHPTIREPDGLALSSRNARLTPAQRADAPRLHRALRRAATATTPALAIQTVRHELSSPLNQIDYVEVVDAETLQPAADFLRPTLLAAAVFYGSVRLIDHLPLPARRSTP